MESVSNAAPAQAKPTAESGSQTHERSSIVFPYTDLDNAVEIVRGVHTIHGTTCTFDQLAAHLGAGAKGGGFRSRVNSARIFGLLNNERGGRITLTDAGHRIIDPTQQRAARAAAFLNVPLYEQVFNEFKGRQLPPQAALERALIGFGVGVKVAELARQVMLRSARQAGYFELSPDRLIAPPIRDNQQPQTTPDDGGGANQNAGDTERSSANRGGGGGSGGGGQMHPLIQGLLLTLPEPKTEWPVADRLNWLAMANSIFKMIYANPSRGDVELKLTETKMS